MKDEKKDVKPEVEKVDHAEERLSDDDLEAITGGTIIRVLYPWEDINVE